MGDGTAVREAVNGQAGGTSTVREVDNAPTNGDVGDGTAVREAVTLEIGVTDGQVNPRSRAL